MLDYNNVKCSLIYTTEFHKNYNSEKCSLLLQHIKTATVKQLSHSLQHTVRQLNCSLIIRQQLKCSPKLNVYSNDMFASTLQMSDGRWRCRLTNFFKRTPRQTAPTLLSCTTVPSCQETHRYPARYDLTEGLVGPPHIIVVELLSFQ